MSRRFFDPQPFSIGAEYLLGAGPAHHIARVLRMQVGDTITVFNGEGGEYVCAIADIRKDRVSVNVLSFSDVERTSPLSIHLAQAFARGDRFDFALQKATELGVAEITPLYTAFGERPLKGEQLEKKMAHWQGVVTAACEQCERNRVPVLHAPQTADAFFTSGAAGTCWILHPRIASAAALPAIIAPLTIAIGPEGGFSEAEFRLASENGFVAVELGPRILRTETAPIVALTLAQSMAGDLPHLEN